MTRAAQQPVVMTTAALAVREQLRALETILELSEEVLRLRARNRVLEKQLGLNVKFPSVLSLTPLQERLLRVLRAEDWATRQRLHDEIYTSLGRDRVQANIKVQIFHLRRRLKPHGIKIEAVGRKGWRLPAAAKRKLKTIMERSA